MKYHFIFAAFTVFVASACQKDPDQTGCTDHLAINYDPRAIENDESCAYNQAFQSIWNNGQYGGWNGDLHEGAYRLEVCAGEVANLWMENAQELNHDPAENQNGLFLSTSAGSSHRSYFSLINERNARDYAEGTLRFGCRATVESPEFIRVFFSGKLIQNEDCLPYRRSEFVEIATRSFNDSTYTEVAIPIRHFGKIMMAHVEVVCGIEFEGDRNSGIEINNIRLSANRER